MKVKALIISLFLIITVSNAETVTTNTNNVPFQLSNTDSRVIDLIPANTALEKISEQGSFYNVKYNWQSGWIAKIYTNEGQQSLTNIGTVESADTTYIVKTDLPNALPAVNAAQLTQMITNCYSGARRSNLLSLVNSFIQMQEKHKVNAVFAVAASVIESGGGTNGKLLSEHHSYNMFSIKGSYNGQSVSFMNSNWRKYSSFHEAVMDFGHWIANSSHYFKKGRYTPGTIGPTYCNYSWGVKVSKQMYNLYKSISS